MSSSPTSSSSTNAGVSGHAGPGAAAPAKSEPQLFPGLMDVTMPLAVRLGTGSVTVGQCLSLRPQSIVRLNQSVGQDLDLVVNGETIARGEVAIVDDSTSIRLTDIAMPQIEEVEP
jgi:flagellar motor switch protein FliN